MDNTVVRLEALTIENFKNVKKGHLTFANSMGKMVREKPH